MIPLLLAQITTPVNIEIDSPPPTAIEIVKPQEKKENTLHTPSLSKEEFKNSNNIPKSPQNLTNLETSSTPSNHNELLAPTTELDKTNNNLLSPGITELDKTNDDSLSLPTDELLSSPPITESNNSSSELLSPSPLELKNTKEIQNISSENYSQNNITHLLTKSRQGKNREFTIKTNTPQSKIKPLVIGQTTDNQEIDSSFAQENNQISTEEQKTEVIEEKINVVEVVADSQEYLDNEQIIIARGNVIIRFSNGILNADEVKINLVDRLAVATGDVILKRGDQKLRGERFEYYFVQDKGIIFNASGEIYQPNLAKDFTNIGDNNPITGQPLSWQFEKNQPLQRVTSAEGYLFVAGSVRDYGLLPEANNERVISTQGGGQVNRLRFRAEKVDFNKDGWHATNISFTNDPFSPPEFEVVADTADLRSISPYQDELVTSRSRLVFDRKVSLPLFQDRSVFDRRQRNSGLLNLGFDGEDRGGLYIEKTFDIYTNENVEFSITPQFLLQRAFSPESFDDIYAINPDDNGGLTNPSSYGLVAVFDANLSDRRQFLSTLNFTGLDLDNIGNRLRATVQLNQKIGADLSNPYTASLQYNYRERLFNGSLGFQTVQDSIGAVITSPYIPLGNSGISLVYQGSIQNITADTDDQDLLSDNRENNLANLNRFQAAAFLTGGFFLWKGESLPPTPDQGLKYTSTPVSPYLRLNSSLTGVASSYSNGDSQPSLTVAIGLEGQIGHFVKPVLDYTGFNISYRQGFRGDESPFFFDRFADLQVLSIGLTQQIYGPVRAGLQTFYNVELNEEISTDYFIEYSRRTYNVMLRYNPVLQIGSINLRISDFNWEGNPAPFEGTGIKPVIDGVKIDPQQ